MASLERLIFGTRDWSVPPSSGLSGPRPPQEKPGAGPETRYMADTRAPTVSGSSARHSCMYAVCCGGQHTTPSQGHGEGYMKDGRIAGRMSILHVPSAAEKGLAPGALPLAILGALTVSVRLRWSPDYLPPIGLLRRAALFTAFTGPP